VLTRTTRLDPRRWSIGLRTAVAFGVAFALLCSLVVLGVALATSQGVALSLEGPGGAVPAAERVPGAEGGDLGGTDVAVMDPPDAGPGSDGSVPTVVARVLARQQLIWSSIGVAAAALVAGGVGWVVSRRMLRPLDDIVETTQAITARTLHERIALVGPRDELARVADTIDGLLDRLERSFEAQRRFVADASHELRTPLAVQRAAIQIGLDDPAPGELARTREQLLDANRRSEALIDGLLTLATADRGLGGAERTVELNELVPEVATGLIDEARASSVDVVILRGTFRRVPGEPVLLAHLVRNLVSNAVEYNVPGGHVRVLGTPEAVVVVENTGPVVTAEQAATLTRPFIRVDRHGGTPSRGGTVSVPHSGLGLAIVDSIARAHGWRVRVEPRPGGGLRVSVG
jgi:signal transduction histidine kinase